MYSGCLFSLLGEPSLLWVDKYRPRTVKHIIGQQGDKSNMRKLMNWLRDWEKNRKKPPTKCECVMSAVRVCKIYIKVLKEARSQLAYTHWGPTILKESRLPFVKLPAIAVELGTIHFIHLSFSIVTSNRSELFFFQNKMVYLTLLWCNDF